MFHSSSPHLSVWWLHASNEMGMSHSATGDCWVVELDCLTDINMHHSKTQLCAFSFVALESVIYPQRGTVYNVPQLSLALIAYNIYTCHPTFLNKCVWQEPLGPTWPSELQCYCLTSFPLRGTSNAAWFVLSPYCQTPTPPSQQASLSHISLSSLFIFFWWITVIYSHVSFSWTISGIKEVGGLI